MKKKLQNPRGYLSWTQIDLWLRDPERYVKQYMLGGDGDKNDRMNFGSKVATAIETGESTGDITIDTLAATIPRYKKSEHEIRATLKTDKGDVVLLGKLDTFCPDTLAFDEYKTGTTKWTQRMAQNHKQLDHYTTLIYLESGKIPPKIRLIHAQTEVVDGEVSLTGKVTSFEVKKTLSDILQYMAVASRVAKEIDKRYREEIKSSL